jgi:hypothetical protein
MSNNQFETTQANLNEKETAGKGQSFDPLE